VNFRWYNMSKITVTTIAGQTSGSDANLVKIESGDTLQALSNATVGGTLGVTGATTLTGNLTVDTNTLFVDASNNRVGVGTTSPVEALRIQGDSDTDLNISTAVNNRVLMLKNSTAGANNCVTLAMATETNGEVYLTTVENSNNDAADFVISTRASGARAERLRITAAGNITKPSNASFLANLNQNSAMDVGVIPFGTVLHNVGSHYNAANYRFTAPVTGRYFLSYSMRVNHGTSGHIIHPSFHINGSSDTASRTIYKNDASAQYMATTFSYIRQLSASDYVTVSTSGGSSGGTLQSGQCIFSGHLIG